MKTCPRCKRPHDGPHKACPVCIAKLRAKWPTSRKRTRRAAMDRLKAEKKRLARRFKTAIAA